MTMRALVVALGLGLALVAGCGDDGESKADGPSPAKDSGGDDTSTGTDAKGRHDGPAGQPDGSSGTTCLKECTDFYDYLCVKDPATGYCKACLEDKHCVINTRSDGPFCDKANKMCVCKVEADCKGHSTGEKCLQVGNFKMCTCNTDADCPATYTICDGTVIKRCVKPCTSNADCKKGGFTGTCDTKTGKCSYT